MHCVVSYFDHALKDMATRSSRVNPAGDTSGARFSVLDQVDTSFRAWGEEQDKLRYNTQFVYTQAFNRFPIK